MATRKSAAKTGDELTLPKPQTEGGMSLPEALARRRSHRCFAERDVPVEAISQLCWAGQGITSKREGYRTAPSAGAFYPITLLLADRAGVWEYRPRSHKLKRLLSTDVRRDLRRAALDQECLDAPLCMILVMNLRRTEQEYGAWAQRLGTLEAGHVAQNVLLQAAALGLGGVPVGAFHESDITDVLKLPKRRTAVLMLPMGYREA